METKQLYRPTRRRFLGVSLGAAAALGSGSVLLSGCGDGDGASGTEEQLSMTFVTPFGFLVGFAPTLVAKSAGFFEERGLNVTVEGGSGSAQSVQQVIAGQALLSRTGGSDLISAIANEQAPILSVATIAQRSPFEVISSADAPVKTPGDMRGTTMGVVSVGGATEALLDIMLNEAGISSDEVPREAVGNAPGAFSLVESGEIAAFVATGGTRSKLEFQDANIAYVSTDEFAPIPGQAYIATRDAVESQSETIERYLRAIWDSLQFMTEEDEGWEQTIGYLQEWDIAGIDDVEAASYELDVQSHEWSAEDGTMLRNVPDHWAQAQELMASAGLIDAPVSAEDLYTNEFVERVLEE